jgi:hypothetical protein
MKEKTMKTPLTHTKKSIAYATSLLLTLVAAGLAVSALKGASPKQDPPVPTSCKDWPAKPGQKKVEKAFDKVLNDSATDVSLRKQLLDTSDCYKYPKAAVQKVLDSIPGSKVTIPKDVLIIFYENDTPELKGGQTPRDPDYPSDHCLHIFFLPPTGEQTTTKTSFRDNLMCCYKPWNQ